MKNHRMLMTLLLRLNTLAYMYVWKITTRLLYTLNRAKTSVSERLFLCGLVYVILLSITLLRKTNELRLVKAER